MQCVHMIYNISLFNIFKQMFGDEKNIIVDKKNCDQFINIFGCHVEELKLSYNINVQGEVFFSTYERTFWSYLTQ